VRLLSIFTSCAETERQSTKLRRYFLRDAECGEFWPELRGRGEDGAKYLQGRESAIRRGRRGEQIVKSEAVDVRSCPGEVGMHLEAVLVAYHQQGRILQVFPVVRQLEVRGLQVFVFALVLPREETSLPHVGIALAAFELGDVLLKGEIVPRLIGGGGVRLSQHLA
jgi:hypothetical protein